MLPKPNIIKMPDASAANLSGGLRGCNSGFSGHGVTRCTGFNCRPVSGSNCIDANFSSNSCGVGLGVGVISLGIGAVGLGVMLT